MKWLPKHKLILTALALALALSVNFTVLRLTSGLRVSAANLVPNASLEQVSDIDPEMPADWQKNSWGTNAASFEYLEEGHTGSRSVKVTVSGYESGDAKWYFDPQPLAQDQWYRFSAYYRTNSEPRVVAMFVHDDDSISYFGMPIPFPTNSGDWQLYQSTFIVPADAKSTSVFFFLNQDGWLQTDDYLIETYQPIGFDRPLVSLTFDDGAQENVSTLIPRLADLGFRSTQFYATTFIEGDPVQEENVLEFKDAGHEIGSHSVTHPFLSRVTPDQLEYELEHSREYLKGLLGTPVCNFAAPFGDYNRDVNQEVRRFYRAHRTVDEGYNSRDNLDPYRIRVQNLHVDTTLSEFQSWLDRARADKTWLVLVYHRISETDPGDYDSWASDFDQQMAALVASGITVKPLNEALYEIIQPLIDEIEPAKGIPGEIVTLKGDNFGCERGSTRVDFNGVDAQSFESWSNEEIEVEVPLGATSGPVRVITSSRTSNAVDFEVEYPPPEVSGVTPAEGKQGQALSGVRVRGSHFQDGAETLVKLEMGGDSIVASGVEVASPSLITCDLSIPENAATGAWDLLLENPDGKTGEKKKAFRVVERTPPVNGKTDLSTWYLAEGSTAWGYDCYISIENPNNEELDAEITYMTDAGDIDGGSVRLPASSQTTLRPRELLGERDFSTRVECRQGKAIAVDRTMTWTSGENPADGHSSIGATAPSNTWFLAEGSSRWGFECWHLIQNPGEVAAQVELTYMVEGREPVSRKKVVEAKSRATYEMIAEAGEVDASLAVESDVPVIAERAMYRDGRAMGHDSTGVAEPSRDFYLAEGTTGYGFTTYLLIQNPNEVESEVGITYMTADGGVSHPENPISMPPGSRMTIRVNDYLPDSDFSTHVSGSRPIIAERAMYWGEGSVQGGACHDSVGLSSPHEAFYLPDGQTSDGRETYTLIQNPNDAEVAVEVSYLAAGGDAYVNFTDTIGAMSRKTYSMADTGIEGRAAIVVTSLTAGRGVVVERAMYWDFRGAGTATIGGHQTP